MKRKKNLRRNATIRIKSLILKKNVLIIIIIDFIIIIIIIIKRAIIENPKASSAGVTAYLYMCIYLLLLSLLCIFPVLFRALHFNDQISVLRKILIKFPKRHLVFLLYKKRKKKTE